MYDYSGRYMFRVGLPAKSGVAGAVMIVVPGLMGICTYSPKLDEYGNSSRGVQFSEEMSDRFAMHLFQVDKANELKTNLDNMFHGVDC